MKKLLLFLFIAVLIQEAFAQVQQSTPELERRPAQVSLLPMMGTNGREALEIYQPLSFNLIGGYNGGVSGFEWGWIFNKDKYFMTGFQIAGVTNIVEGYVRGVQMAGINNITQEEMNGVQLAGIMNSSRQPTQIVQVAGVINKSEGSSSSQQFAGAVNLASGQIDGSQFAGLVNQVQGSITGIQAGGLVNVADDSIQGVQMAGLYNRASDVNGLQMGLVNVAKNSKGLQIGLINKADSAQATLGLINIVRNNGYYRGEVWTSESFYANGAFKMGTNKLYSVLAAGWRQDSNGYHLAYGFGLGTELFSKGSSALNLDLIQYQLSENGFYSKGMNNLSQSRLTWAKEIKGNNAIFLGLTFHFLNTDHSGMSDGEYKMDIAPGYIYERITENRRYAMWPGLNVGFRF